MILADPPAATAEPVLRCVAIPLVRRDIGPNLEKALALWSDDRFFPRLNSQVPRPHLMVMVNNASSEQLARVEAMFQAQPRLMTCFSGFSAHSADLKGDRDTYIRSPLIGCGVYGTRAGPSFLFLRTLQQAGGHGGFTLQIELDCLPVQAGWIEATQHAIDDHASAWVIGSLYAGTGEVDADTQSHLNGNALYRTGDGRFRSFLHELWLPRLLEQTQRRPNLAYDCWWALERAQASALSANEAWHLFQTYDGFFHVDPFVVNLLSRPEDVQDYIRVFEKFYLLGRTAVFFHGPAMPVLRQQLLDYPEDSIFDGIDRMAPPDAGRRPLPLPATAGPDAVCSHPMPATQAASWLERFADRMRKDTPSDARLLLRAAAARLMVDRGQALKNLERSQALSWAIDAARRVLGPNHDAVIYFDRILAAARGVASTISIHDHAA